MGKTHELFLAGTKKLFNIPRLSKLFKQRLKIMTPEIHRILLIRGARKYIQNIFHFVTLLFLYDVRETRCASRQEFKTIVSFNRKDIYNIMRLFLVRSRGEALFSLVTRFRSLSRQEASLLHAWARIFFISLSIQ